MARKYEKYVISEPSRVLRTHDTGTYPFEVYLNNEIVPGCNTFSDIYWRKKIPDINPAIPMHKHDEAPMLLYFVGEPGSFEVEVPMDDEVYKITKTTLIWVPPGVMHSVDYKRIDNVVVEIGVVLKGVSEPLEDMRGT